MEKVWSEISGICRLCLCEGDEILIPARKILDLPSAIENLERCTGIRIVELQNIPYSICEDCNCKLKDFATFRTVCLTNDGTFKNWFPMVFENEKQHNITDHSGYIASHPLIEKNVQKIEYLEIEDDVSDCSNGDHRSMFDGELEIDEELEENNAKKNIAKNVRIRQDLSVHVNDGSEQENEQQMPSTDKRLAPGCLHTRNQRAEHDSTPKSAQQEDIKQNGNKVDKKQLCPICGKLVYDMLDHKLSHTNEKKYACPHCSMAYGRKAYLKFHIQSVHQKKVVKTCDLCQQNFAYKTGYDAHMRARHNIGKWYECKPCNMKFRHPGGLRNHNNRKHNEGSNCECPVCGLKFLDKMGLRNHSRVHSSEKKFACKYCPKRFRSPNAHRGHELTHMGVTFRCPHCPKSYRYKQNLKIHLSKHDEKERA